MTHCLNAFKITWRFQSGIGKVWIALDRETGKEVARHKRRKVCAAIAVQRFMNTHKGSMVI